MRLLLYDTPTLVHAIVVSRVDYRPRPILCRCNEEEDRQAATHSQVSTQRSCTRVDQITTTADQLTVFTED